MALAIDTHHVRQAIGALAVTMGGVEPPVFTAGVGKHAAEIRASVRVGLDFLGLELDREINAACRVAADVASRRSRGRFLVIAVRQDVTMLHEVVRVLGG